MNSEIYQIDFARFISLQDDYDEAVFEAGKLSSEIIVGMYSGRVLCYIGIIPQTFLSESGYVWMIMTDFGEKHRFIIARRTKRALAHVQQKYSRLFGHCFAESSRRWLESLGAKFTSETEFEFRRG